LGILRPMALTGWSGCGSTKAPASESGRYNGLVGINGAKILTLHV